MHAQHRGPNCNQGPPAHHMSNRSRNSVIMGRQCCLGGPSEENRRHTQLSFRIAHGMNPKKTKKGLQHSGTSSVQGYVPEMVRAVPCVVAARAGAHVVYHRTTIGLITQGPGQVAWPTRQAPWPKLSTSPKTNLNQGPAQGLGQGADQGSDKAMAKALGKKVLAEALAKA